MAGLKRIDPGDHYAVLGVEPHVGSGQLQAAYRFAMSLYTGDGAACRGFLSDAEKSEVLQRLALAHQVLSDATRRATYDAARKEGRAIASAPTAFEPLQRGERSEPPRVEASQEESAGRETSHARPPLEVPQVVRGETLKELREARGATLPEIVALSKIGLRFLQALEADQHAKLPGRVFARGFLIEFGRAIGVNEAELAERYLRNWNVAPHS